MLRVKQSIVIVLPLCLLLIGTIKSQATTLNLSLDETILVALMNNPQIEVARQQYLAGEGIVTQARSSYWPRLSTGADISRVNIKDLLPEDEDNVGHLSLRINQLLWDFGRTTGLVDTSRFNRQASDENLKQVHHDIVFQVKTDFYSVLEKRRLIEVAEQAVANYEQQLYRAKKYYEAGVRTKIDVTNAEVNLSGQKLSLLQARSNLKAARVKLEKTLGTKPNNGEYRLADKEVLLELLAETKPEMPESLKNLLETAEQFQPGITRYNYLVKAAESALDQAEADYWPAVSASGEYHEYETDLSTLYDQWQVGIGLNWEFFSGFETEGKIAEAGARLREVKAALKEYELSVTQSVTDSYLRAEENREGVDIAAQTLLLSKENLELADGRYKAGLGDILEYNDAQLLYTQNQSSLVITYYTYLTSLARIERAIGVIPELVGYDIYRKKVTEEGSLNNKNAQ